jgi:hypothetical protein
MAALVLPLSFSGGAVATPAIGRDLGGSPIALNWITNAFMLTFGSLLMAAGALADEFGRKRLFIFGVALFVVISLALTLLLQFYFWICCEACRASPQPPRYPVDRRHSLRSSKALHEHRRSACWERPSVSVSHSVRFLLAF